MESETTSSSDINWKLHQNLIKMCLNGLPGKYGSQDPNRLTLSYFLISAYDLLDLTDELPKDKIIDWIYAHQIVPDKDNPEKNKHNCGWRGSTFFGAPFDPSGQPTTSYLHDQGHIAMTYVALGLLLILGDDFSRVNKRAILEALPFLQQSNGSFSPLSGGCESDMRYVYCACSICYMLNDWSTFDKEKTLNYILRSQSYDCAFAQTPGEESHGGSTYCAIASLALMGRLDALPHKNKLLQWLIYRQQLGFNGRPNKIQDTCYSFWVGASIRLLGYYDTLVIEKHTRNYSIGCQKSTGGFAKWSDQPADPLHTYFSLCGLSFLGEPGLKSVHPGLGFSSAAHDRLKEIHPNFQPMTLLPQ